jgi:hypothetical protein
MILNDDLPSQRPSTDLNQPIEIDSRGPITTGEEEIEGIGQGEFGEGDNIGMDSEGPAYDYPESPKRHEQETIGDRVSEIPDPRPDRNPDHI